MSKKQLLCSLGLLIGLFLFSGTSWAQKNPAFKKAAKDKVPVVITAQQAEFNNKARKAIYKGNVKVLRGDSTMYSDELEAFLDEEGNDIDHIVAIGNVRVLQDGKEITSEKAVYYEAEQKVILTGNPVSKEGMNVVKGTRMVYYFNQERILVENAVSELHPDKTEKENKK